MKIIRSDTSFTVTDFKLNPKYNYRSYTRNDNNGPRTYNVDDKKVPSVTTIISGTQPKEKVKL